MKPTPANHPQAQKTACAGVIHAHPEICHNPLDIAAIEFETGLKAVICGKGIKLVDDSILDDYELVERQSYLSMPGKFAGDMA